MRKAEHISTTVSSSWPEGGLERMSNCPLCSSSQRVALHTGLTDRQYFIAAGEWNLCQCLGCNCAYLDPRPTPETIGLAYEGYYTHNQPQRPEAESLSKRLRLRRTIANGYRNWRFGTDYQPASSVGIAVAMIFPGLRAAVDRGFRNLPRPESGARLLDVGFGGGAFLEFARDAGWTVAGADPDQTAITAATKRGLDVRHGGIEAFLDMPEYFDVITMNHVIEHVHDPRTTLNICYQLLKPGGFLWFSTPNIESFCHQQYGRNWLALDPPRHIVLLNWPIALTLLEEVGFRSIRREEDNRDFEKVDTKSKAIAMGLDPYATSRVPVIHRLRGATARMITFFRPDRTENITLRAYKPLRGA